MSDEARRRSRPALGVTLLVAMAVASACTGANPRATPTATSTGETCPTTRPTSGAHSLGEGDSGADAHLRVGEHIAVGLRGGNYDGYPIPHVVGVAIERAWGSGGYPTPCEARANFVAVAPGSARLESQTDFFCLHSKPPCLPPSKTWSVRVFVRR